MPFQQTPEIFGQWVEEALKTQEIVDGAAKSGLDNDLLTAKAIEKKDVSWNRAASLIANYDSLEKSVQEANVKIGSALPSDSIFRNSVGIFFVLAVVIFIVMAGSYKSAVAPYRLVSDHFNLAGTAAVITLALIYLLLWWRHRRSSIAIYAEIRKEVGLEDQEKRLKEAQDQIKSAVIGGILEEIREFINAQLGASFGSKLTVVRQSGLAEVFNPRFEIDTPTKQRLVRLLDTVPGASIGIAGPRGSGKTTLLDSLCRTAGSDEKPALSVFTSAPVEYTPRDFILHLYSSLCRRVLEARGVKDRKVPLTELLRRESLTDSTPPKEWKAAGALLTTAGTFLLLTGLTLVGINLWLKPIPATSQQTGQSTNELAKIISAAHNELATFISAAHLEVNPSPVLQWGLTILSLGLAVMLLFEWPRLLSGILSLRSWFPFGSGKKIDAPLAKDQLAEQAKDRLDEIRFQQSFSSGWSGALKLPIGLENSISKGISLVRNQQSLPEVVDSFRDFLKECGNVYSKIIICIDELDKLETDDQAHQFLNQIKAVFGLPRCFYLISVSENAISSFERRGLPFRDVFDSCLDTIIYLDYFDLADCQRLLQRRVIGMPVPFVCLCYCMSGGLPRDLLRECRNLLEMNQADPGIVELPAVCAELMRRDVQGKLRAISIAAQQVNLQTEVSGFVSKINRFKVMPIDSASLERASSEILGGPAVSRPRRDTDFAAAQYAKFEALREEIAAYLYYCATVLGFVEWASGSSWEDAVKVGIPDELARARRALALDTQMSIAMISEFRKERGLTLVDFKKAS